MRTSSPIAVALEARFWIGWCATRGCPNCVRHEVRTPPASTRSLRDHCAEHVGDNELLLAFLGTPLAQAHQVLGYFLVHHGRLQVSA